MPPSAILFGLRWIAHRHQRCCPVTAYLPLYSLANSIANESSIIILMMMTMMATIRFPLRESCSITRDIRAMIHCTIHSNTVHPRPANWRSYYTYPCIYIYIYIHTHTRTPYASRIAQPAELDYQTCVSFDARNALGIISSLLFIKC